MYKITLRALSKSNANLPLLDMLGSPAATDDVEVAIFVVVPGGTGQGT